MAWTLGVRTYLVIMLFLMAVIFGCLTILIGFVVTGHEGVEGGGAWYSL